MVSGINSTKSAAASKVADSKDKPVQPRQVWLTSDNISGKAADLKRLQEIVRGLKAEGIDAHVYGIGPDMKNKALTDHRVPANAVVADVAYMCAGTLYEKGLPYWQKWKGNKKFMVVDWSPTTKLSKIDYLPRAHDDNFSPKSFKGLSHPLEYLKEHHIDYDESRSIPELVKHLDQLATDSKASTKVTTKASTPTAASMPTLVEGARGQAVKELQEELIKHGYNPSGVDGYFGPKTRAAVLAYQRAHGLKQDGVVGPITWGKLLGTHAAKSTATTAKHGSSSSSTSVDKSGWNLVASYKYDKEDEWYKGHQTVTCGPTSMDMLFSELAGGKRKISQDTIAGIAGTNGKGTSPDEMVAAAKKVGNKVGIPVNAYNASFDSVGWAKLAEMVKDPKKGVIMHIKTGGLPGWKGDFGHYVFPIGVNLKTHMVRIADPIKGVRDYTFSEYEAAMGRVASSGQLVVVDKK